MDISDKKIALVTWRFLIRHRPGFLDAEAERLKEEIADLGVSGVEKVEIAAVYYCRGDLKPAECDKLGVMLLADPITQEWEATPVASLRGAKNEIPRPSLRGPEDRSNLGFETGSGQAPQSGFKSEIASLPSVARNDDASSVEVAYRPGVRDPVEDSLKKGALDLGVTGIQAVHTAKSYTFTGSLDARGLGRICDKLLVNPCIQQVVTPENLQRLFSGSPSAPVAIETVHLLQASDTVLQRISLDHQLSLNLEEMRAIQSYYRAENREPALIELETIAQTWSEHCKHKTFRSPIVYTEEKNGKPEKRVIPDLLKETVMRATQELNKPWCVSVFSDNSGVIRFDDQFDVCFKVETHNHPSALEPFGGASTGIGGVIRDILGTGLGAKPIASTDVFCFAPPDLSPEQIPPGALQPRRIIKGVVAGVKDYGNKMGIPTVNGAVLFDERFVGNPLVYCGNVGLLPTGMVTKQVSAGMKIVVAGGRTGRDGIHGATFSSLALTSESEVISATAVQIGDPITEKKLADALLEARDQGLYSAVTDCGAGGLSSAVGEMGEKTGARVDLELVPLKYAGLNPTEIWISESQERMVLAVPPEKLDPLLALFRRRGVEASTIGEFTKGAQLELCFKGTVVGRLKMDFLHGGLPKVARPARWIPPALQEPAISPPGDLTGTLEALLGRWDTCSKEWIIRQYDHEVQGGSALKPLIGVAHKGPSDAAIVKPRLNSSRGIALSNGINFRYGEVDPYWMAALVIDEAVRQIIAVGGSLDQLAILDNFCWGDPTRVEVLGSLVRAAQGCYDAAKAFGVPFISGKDSLHNEYRHGEKTIQIPGTLLISAIGVMADVTVAVSMDAKKAGNKLYIVGQTKQELGGSAYYDLQGVLGASVPQVDLKTAPAVMRALSHAMASRLVVSAHDCSEGGLAVAAAEMAFAGGLGVAIALNAVPRDPALKRDDFILFSESASRFLVEVPPEKEAAFQKALIGFPAGCIGEFQAAKTFQVTGMAGRKVIDATIEKLQEAWERPFKGW